MAKYVCSICGYIYDEANGVAGPGIVSGTAWEDLPDDWVCPTCGATKNEFENMGKPAVSEEKVPIPAIEISSDMRKMTPLEMSALCTNLARGCEKQYKLDEAALFIDLAGYFKTASAPAKVSNYDELVAFIEKDLEEGFHNAKSVLTEAHDSGALRALVWSEKVTRILKSLLARYQKEGEAMLENTCVYVCTVCGFVYVGDNLPEICPVCKVPNWKLEKVEGR